LLLQELFEQHVKLFHAAPANPFQLADAKTGLFSVLQTRLKYPGEQ